MKTLYRTITILLYIGFLSFTSAQSSITISGAGSNSLNQEYLYIGLFNGKPAFENPQGNRDIRWNRNGNNEWTINVNHKVYYVTNEDSYFPPSTNWHLGSKGKAPVPQLSGDVNLLPVELVSSSISFLPSSESFSINWETSTEINNYGFIVIAKQIRNQKEINFYETEFIKGAGNSSNVIAYSSRLSISNKAVNDVFEITIKQIDNDGTIELHKIGNYKINNSDLIGDFKLSQNYPNPFNPNTKIEYTIPTNSKVRLTVYNIIGKEVSVLVNKEQPQGSYTVNFDASNLASGTYLYRIEADNFVQIKKMILIK